jgi:chloramphenicol 3-O phosphotransferase
VTDAGTIVVLNGVPRSGKSTIAAAMQGSLNGVWMNFGVDAFTHYATPQHLKPGIGLRPGGERPDLEAHLPMLFDALYGSVIASSRVGMNVVVDIGHHDDYTRPFGILFRVAEQLAELNAYFVGVRCPVAIIMDRRDASGPEDRYVASGPSGGVPEIVLRWEQVVHDPGIYDLEVDTSVQSPTECASAIGARIRQGRPTAFAQLARLSSRN